MFRARVAAALTLAVFAAGPLAPPPVALVVHAQVDAARIPLAEFKKLHDAGKVLVVDTRDAQSYRAGHIPGAILVSQDMVPAKLAEVKAGGKLVVAYCTWPAENSSARVALLLAQGGVEDARALLGGWAAWVNAGYPVKTGDRP